jgi:hypothetical protein
MLLVPTAVDLVIQPPPPDPATHDVDHYKCYKVRSTSGMPKFPPAVQVTMADAFTAPAKMLDVKRPRLLCVPVDKNGEGIKNPARHLMCYKVKVALGAPPHTPQLGVRLNNALGRSWLDSKREDMLCVPAGRTP